MIFEECEYKYHRLRMGSRTHVKQWMNLDNTRKTFFFLITYSTVTLNEL